MNTPKKDEQKPFVLDVEIESKIISVRLLINNYGSIWRGIAFVCVFVYKCHEMLL